MPTDREVMQQALDALEAVGPGCDWEKHADAIDALRAQLAKPDVAPAFICTRPACESDNRIYGHVLNSFDIGTYLYFAKPDTPCPHIRGSDEGTNWCALAAETINQQETYRTSIPDGWKLVPVEPTEAMVEAFGKALVVQQKPLVLCADEIYSAMLNAAPQPESGE